MPDLGSTAKLAIIGCAFVILFPIPFLVGFAWRVVDYDEYGLLYNTFSKVIVNETYGPGRWYVGLGNDFHRFKSTLQTIEFSDDAAVNDSDRNKITVRATDGQSIGLELSFQYGLDPIQLLDLYKDFKFEFEGFYVRTARGELQDVAAQYSSQDYSDRRTEIELVMTQALERELGVKRAVLAGFQLRKVELPTALEQRLLDIQLEAQNALLAEAKLEATRIRTQTQNLVLELSANSTQLITQIEQQTANDVALINAATEVVREETNRQVQELRTIVESELLNTYQQIENTRLTIDQNRSAIEERTVQEVARIFNELEVLAAEKNAVILDLQTQATATSEILVASADAEAATTLLAAEKGVLQSIIASTSSDAAFIIAKTWIDVVENHNTQSVFFDTQKPDQVWLPGQRESYYAALSGDNSSGLI